MPDALETASHDFLGTRKHGHFFSWVQELFEGNKGNLREQLNLLLVGRKCKNILHQVSLLKTIINSFDRSMFINQ